MISITPMAAMVVGGHLMLLAMFVPRYVMLLRRPNRPHWREVAHRRGFLELVLAAAAVAALTVEVFERHNEVRLMGKLLGWLFSLHSAWMCMCRTDDDDDHIAQAMVVTTDAARRTSGSSGELDNSSAPAPPTEDLAPVGWNPRGAELAEAQHAAQLARECRRNSQRRLRVIRVWWVVMAVVLGLELRANAEIGLVHVGDSLATVAAALLAIVACFSLLQCVARDSAGASMPDAKRQGSFSAYRDAVRGKAEELTRELDGLPAENLRIALVSVGTRGDVQPFVGLAIQLKARGHSVVVCATNKFKGFVERHGVEFVTCGMEDIPHNEAWHAALTLGEMMEACTESFHLYPNMFKGIYDAARGASTVTKRPADLLVGSTTTANYLLDIAEMQTDVPTTAVSSMNSVATFPIGWVNFGSHVMTALQIIGGAMKTSLEAMTVAFRRDVLNLGPQNKLARFNELVYMPTIFAVPPTAFAKPLDWPRWHWVTGTLMLDAGHAVDAGHRTLPADLDAFIKQRGDTVAPVVCVTFGSMVLSSRVPLVVNAVRGVLALGYRCLFISGGSTGLDVPIPKDDPNLFTIRAAPHDLVFPHCAAVVHHGGCGTTARCLHSGTPSVIVPILLWSDQPFWGRQVQRSKCGMVVGGTGAVAVPSQGALEKAIRSAVTDLTIRAAVREAAARLEAETANVAAAQLLESCLCRRMLSPTDINVVQEAPSPDGLPSEMAMCWRHCPVCSKRRRDAESPVVGTDGGSATEDPADGGSSTEDPAAPLRRRRTAAAGGGSSH